MNQPAITMPSFDADGFMWNCEEWNEATARLIAHVDGVGDLDARQVSLLHSLRANYLRRGGLPAWPHVCHLVGFAPDCLTSLFPDAREAWRIAGLPNPGEEAKAYM
jgi:dissimilatory sulfite reductase related protein